MTLSPKHRNLKMKSHEMWSQLTDIKRIMLRSFNDSVDSGTFTAVNNEGLEVESEGFNSVT